MSESTLEYIFPDTDALTEWWSTWRNTDISTAELLAFLEGYRSGIHHLNRVAAEEVVFLFDFIEVHGEELLIEEGEMDVDEEYMEEEETEPHPEVHAHDATFLEAQMYAREVLQRNNEGLVQGNPQPLRYRARREPTREERVQIDQWRQQYFETPPVPPIFTVNQEAEERPEEEILTVEQVQAMAQALDNMQR